jgi:hypothetical protein
MNKERPDLRAMALVHNEGDMTARLDLAIERSERARVVNGAGSKLIEHEPAAKVQSIRRV